MVHVNPPPPRCAPPPLPHLSPHPPPVLFRPPSTSAFAPLDVDGPVSGLNQESLRPGLVVSHRVSGDAKRVAVAAVGEAPLNVATPETLKKKNQ